MPSFFPRDVLDEILDLSQFLGVFLPTLNPGTSKHSAIGYSFGTRQLAQGP